MKSSLLKRVVTVVISIVMISSSLTGCKKDSSNNSSVKKYIDANATVNMDSGTVFETEKYSLFWDNEKKCVLLNDIKNQTYWSSIPYSYYLEEEPYGVGMVRMHSPIYIEYIMENNLRTAYAQVGAISEGEVVAQKTEKGIRVTYFFANEQISVPVDYLLCDEGLEVRLIIDEIRENKYPIYSVSISPFMCGAKNNTDSYLFVPSGSGTLMYPDDIGRNIRTISEYVYGEDLAVTKFEKTTNTEKIRMPVFGVKNNDDALCAIITKGAECARIDAEVGNPEYGYSSVYATFLLRGSNTLVINDSQGSRKQIITNTEDIIDEDYFSVVYTPLAGTKANYVGMAEVFRDWLKKEYDLKAAEKNPTPLHLEFYGGALVNKNLFGISYESLLVATKYSDAEKIIGEIKENTGIEPTVQLTGFGENGLNIGKIAGGMKLSGKFGNFKEFKEYCDSNDLDLYVDFDVICFSKSGQSVNKLFDSAVTSNDAIAKQYYFSKESFNRNGNSYNIIARDKILNITNKLLKYVNKEAIPGVALSSLSANSYSNYPETDGYNKYGFSSVVKKSMNSFTKAKISVMTSNSNDYAAMLSDKVVGAPTKSSGYDGYDVDVPFYEIVFKDLTDVAVSSVNLAIEPEKQFLKAMETGTGLSFSLCGNWDKQFSNSNSSVLQFSLYDSWRKEISDMVNKAKDWYCNVRNASIVKHKCMEENLYYTEFSNGAYIYVNYSDSAKIFHNITIKGNDYIYTLGGE